MFRSNPTQKIHFSVVIGLIALGAVGIATCSMGLPEQVERLLVNVFYYGIAGVGGLIALGIGAVTLKCAIQHKLGLLQPTPRRPHRLAPH